MSPIRFVVSPRVSRAIALVLAISTGAAVSAQTEDWVYEPGHPSLQGWLLGPMPVPANNALTPDRIELGKKLFFDPRLSGDGSMSCASCHNPMMGWSDGLPTGIGFQGVVLDRASPTIFNAGYNTLQMWDGREATLESQAMGPMEANHEMNMNISALFDWLRENPDYSALFAAAYPGEAIGEDTVSKAIASFERTVVSNNSPFDRWVKGDANAMTPQQVAGFELFNGKANCVACHMPPNFTDNGFHNLGLASFGEENPDLGRYAQRPLGLMKGAFKTPTLRDVERTAPYFHDGSAETLLDVVEHYNSGGVVKTNLSPNMKALDLSDDEKAAVVAFMEALTSPYQAVALPELPY